MGIDFKAKCNDCGAILRIGCVSTDDFSLLLRCDRCGGERRIRDDETEKIKSKEYLQEIERTAEKCKCGGNPKFDAPPRCPKCRSKNINQVGSTSFHE